MKNIVLPYRDKFNSKIGNFIKPDGTFVSLNIVHEEFAKAYCRGDNYNRLKELKMSDNEEEYKETIKLYSDFYRRDPKFEEYISSNLDDDELELYRIWDKKDPYNSTSFLVQVLGWDKIETSIIKSISTSSDKPHIRFYNYYLMDWEIGIFKRLIYDYDSKKFILADEKKEFSLSNHKDNSYEEELNHIKKHVKSKRIRNSYFK